MSESSAAPPTGIAGISSMINIADPGAAALAQRFYRGVIVP